MIRHCRLDRDRYRLDLLLRCGDLQHGYVDLRLLYLDIRFTRSSLADLRAIVGDPETEALYDEVDSGEDGRWVHRILFRPHREIAIEYGQLALRVTPQAGRSFRRSGREIGNRPE